MCIINSLNLVLAHGNMGIGVALAPFMNSRDTHFILIFNAAHIKSLTSKMP
jgi:hypothetical protein